MAVTNYFSVGGQVRSEKGSLGYLYYARDNVGSVSSTHDTSGAVYNTYSYNPYGGVSKGTGPFYINRRFLWCGSWGYSYINKTAQWLSYYVRARHYSALQGMWNTRDPLWPTEAANRYGNSSPASSVDPSGNQHTGVPRERPRDPHYVPPTFIGPLKPKYPHFDHEPSCSEIEAALKFYKEPELPKGASYAVNCCKAISKGMDRIWIAGQMWPRGNMDYKYVHIKYDEGGNYNYGIVTRCNGLSKTEALRMAGLFKSKAQGRQGVRGNFSKWPYGNEEDKQLAILWGWCSADKTFDWLKRQCSLFLSCNDSQGLD